MTSKYYQKRMNELVEWRWLLNLNTKNCLVVSFGRDVNKDSMYIILYMNQYFVPTERGDTVRDLGGIFDEKLTFRELTYIL